MTKQRASLWWRAAMERRRSAPALLSIALGGAILVNGAHVGGRILRAQRDLLAVNAVKQAGHPLGKTFEARVVVDAHLFGTPSIRSHGPEGDAGLATSQAPLVLTGTLATPDPTGGSAIVGSESASHLYKVGARLPDGSWMREVYTDRIVLEKDGVLQALRLRRIMGTAGALTPTLTADNSASSTMTPGTESDVTTNPREFSQARQWFNGLMARQAPSSDGSFGGIVLHPIPRYKRQYGLQDGDVVTAINGVALDDPGAATQVLQRARGATVELSIRRDGALQQVKVPLGS